MLPSFLKIGCQNFLPPYYNMIKFIDCQSHIIPLFLKNCQKQNADEYQEDKEILASGQLFF